MDNNEELVVIREYDSITRAETAKSLLESEGIFATIRNEYMSAIYPFQIRHDASACASSMGRPLSVCAPCRSPRNKNCVRSGL